jgi:hypothetical protein
MPMHSESDPSEVLLGSEEPENQIPLSGTIDDDDDKDDERDDENEAPVRELTDRMESRDEFRLDDREEGEDNEPAIDDKDDTAEE